MNDLEMQLDNLDEQLLSYEPKIRWSLYIATLLGIFIMGWMFYLSDALDELGTIKEQNQALSAQLNESSPKAFHAKIAKTLAAVLAEEKCNVSLENDKQSLFLQMSAERGLVFDNRRYAKMLDLLLERSLKEGLKIERMESEDTDTVFFGKVKEFKKLTVSGTGDFPSIAAFLTFIESQNTLVQIQSVQIRSDETKPYFIAVILYMGVAL